MSKIMIIGAGLMGSGIAQVCAVAGYDVVLRDISDEALRRGTGAIAASLAQVRGQGRAERGGRGRGAGADHHHHRSRGRRRGGHRRRGGVRERRGQARAVRRARPARRPGRGAGHEHLGDPDHHHRRSHLAPRVGGRDPLLLPGAHDEAVRAGARLQDLRRDAGPRPGVRRDDRQDLHRGQPGRRGVRDDQADRRADDGGGPARGERCGHGAGRGHRLPPRASATPWAR